MRPIKNILLTSLLINTVCFGYFWSSNETPSIKQSLADNDAMTQNLSINFHYYPVQIKTTPLLPQDCLDNINLKDWTTKTYSFLHTNRFFLCTSFIAGTYIYAYHYITQANKYLDMANLWSSWRSDTPLEYLITIPQQELAKELILEVQRRYSNPQNPTDFITPLITFIQAIENELKIIRKYNRLYHCTTILHVQKMLPFNQKQFKSLNEKYRKLIHIKNIFLSWATEYKINHNKKIGSPIPNVQRSWP